MDYKVVMPRLSDLMDEGQLIEWKIRPGDIVIIGAEIFAPHAEELIAIVAMAIAGEMDAALAKRTILAHPTFSESLEKSFMRL